MSGTLFYPLTIVRIITVLAVMLVPAAGCSSQPPQITIEGQYANLSPIFLGAGSVFLTIRNAGGRDTLVGAAVALPNTTVELHDVEDGRMVRVERIRIPSRDTVELRPGGQHLMVFNMSRTLREGHEIQVLLRFERSGERQVPVRIEKAKETQRRRDQ